MCHDDPFKDEQCMKKETLGTNTFYWVRKCKGAKVCVQLPYYNRMIGACSIKVRSHYDGEVCANGNKCTSGICDGTKCKGLNPDIECEVGLGQCQKGYLCMATSSTSGVYTCQKPLDKDANCQGRVEMGDISRSVYSGGENVFDPSLNPCKLGHVCTGLGTSSSISSYKCVEIGSQSKDTIVTNPLACSSGFVIYTSVSGSSYDYYTCKDAEDGATNTGLSTTTARGGSFSKFTNITKYFNEWLDEWKKKDIKEEDAIYEAYRYTKNKKKINEAFFRYTHAAFVADADECAFDYLWKQESGSSLKFSLMILVLALLF